ncbi:unnamed protein product [Arctogadus glacialis]
MLEVLWLFCLPILGQRLTVPPNRLCNPERVTIVERTKMELAKVNSSWGAVVDPAVSKGVNLTLYTPTTNDMSCRNASLKCFLDEVKVLYIELDVAGESLKGLITSMKRTLSPLSNYPVPEASCEPLSCELHPEMSADSFLQNLGKILKQMNSSYCRKT